MDAKQKDLASAKQQLDNATQQLAKSQEKLAAAQQEIEAALANNPQIAQPAEFKKKQEQAQNRIAQNNNGHT
ncbi:hypothetical protein, partial [Lacticaseibacillus rhamnosus]|uniref:hypothetical protein n=1 Tax=Lacticaseibacillus rhamnosus TaxID=47715 RepID=UPI000CC6DD6E